MKACKDCKCYPDFGEDLIRGRCKPCDEVFRSERNKRARENRKLRESACRAAGLVKVKGALGGTYWE